ncbi:GH3 auxin-responsive promoter family protein [Clostridium thermarum]|uniref:GH3 auxin-responsive promoter family protein n=1 Tax=Clostridium thermarum TaxID=1716543 RepID=UPI00311A9212
MFTTGIFVKLASYSMIKAAKLSEKRYENDTKHAYDINLSILKKILETNKATEIGRKYNFSSINSISDFKSSIPLSTYKDYEDYILRMSRGEKNILFKEEVSYFSISSGTTGKQKLIPVTKTSRRISSSYMGILPQRILYKNFKESWTYGRGLAVTDMTTTSYTESGIPICSATSGGMKAIKRIIPLIWTTPVEVMNLGKGVDTLYLHLLFALKERNLMYISGIFISSVLDLFRYMELHWKELVSDIRKGTISRRIVMEEPSRKKLLSYMSPDAGRADFLEMEFKKGFKGIAKRIWPKLIYIIAVTGANFSIYDDKVAEYTDNLPIYSSAYAASEAVMGVNMHIDRYIYSLIPRTAFYEFIPN